MIRRIPSLRRFDRSCSIVIRWSQDDGAWLASVPELKPCTADGPTPSKALRALDELLGVLEE